MSTISASTTTTTAFKITTDTTGALVFQTGASPTTAVTFDGSQNVGIGATPSAWASGRPAIEFGGATQPVIAFNGNATNGGAIWTNSYFDGSNRYKANGYASRFDTSGGSFGFYTAASGTAGNSFSFTQAMLLDASGNLGLGLTPSAWTSALSGTIETLSGGLYPYHPGGGTYDIGLFVNAYYDGSWRYKNTGSASARYIIGVTTGATSAGHYWGIAGTGTAGNPVTFTEAMTLNGSGNLLVGATGSIDSSFRLQVTGSGGSISHATGANANSFRFINTNTTSQWSFGTNSPGIQNAGDYLAFNRLPNGGSWSEFARIDSTGNVTKPSNSCFLAIRTTNQTPYAAGDTIVFNSEIFDQNSNYNTSTGQFTAPVTGKYLLSATVLIASASVGSDYDFQLFTSNRSYYGAPGRTEYQTTGVSWGDGYIAFQCTQICDMDANDVAYVRFSTAGSGQIYGSGAGDWTRFSGCLIS